MSNIQNIKNRINENLSELSPDATKEEIALFFYCLAVCDYIVGGKKN